MNNYITGFTSYFLFTLFFHKFFIQKKFVYKYSKDKEWFFKILVILPILLILLILSSLVAVIMTSLTIYGVSILVIAIAIFILLLFNIIKKGLLLLSSFLLPFISFFSSFLLSLFSPGYISPPKDIDKKSILSLPLFSLPFLSLPLSILTPDYRFADVYKPKDRVEKYEYIKLMNGINIIISGLILLLYIFIPKFTVGFIFYRCISRSLELMRAFGEDVINPKNRSGLLAGDRLKLAVISYIEVILNYTSLYYLLSMVKSGDWLYKIISLEGSLLTKVPISFTVLNSLKNVAEISSYIKIKNNLTLINCLFKSIGISTFSGIGVDALGPFSSLQLFTSFVLVVFAMASYISNVKNKKKEENEKTDVVQNQNTCTSNNGEIAIIWGVAVLLITIIIFIYLFYLGTTQSKNSFLINLNIYIKNRTFLELMSTLYNMVQVFIIPILTFIGAYLIYITIKQQNNYIKQEKLESRLYTSLDFHRKNIESIALTDPSSKFANLIEGRKALRKIKEFLELVEKEICKLLKNSEIENKDNVIKKIAFLILYYGSENILCDDSIKNEINDNYTMEQIKPELRYWQNIDFGKERLYLYEIFNAPVNGIDNSLKTFDLLIQVLNLKQVAYENPSTFYKFYGGQRGNLEIIFENLKQISKMFKAEENYEYIELIRSQITSQEKFLIKYYKLAFNEFEQDLEPCFDNNFLNV